jgi:hypothetical protein
MSLKCVGSVRETEDVQQSSRQRAANEKENKLQSCYAHKAALPSMALIFALSVLRGVSGMQRLSSSTQHSPTFMFPAKRGSIAIACICQKTHRRNDIERCTSFCYIIPLPLLYRIRAPGHKIALSFCSEIPTC